MLSWNIAGLAATDLALFLDHVELAAPWDFIALQEGFRKLEGLDAGGHGLFTPPELEGGLRCPAVVIHSRRAAGARYVGGRARWLAVDVEEEFLVLSAHLPHIGKSLQDFASTLEEIGAFVQSYPKRLVLLGGDLNTKLAGTSDDVHIGPAVPRVNLRAAERVRASMVMEFVTKLGLTVANTFADCTHEHLMATRENWNGQGDAAQIDFVLASSNLHIAEASVEQYLSCATDHRLVNCEFVLGPAKARPTQTTRCIKNWKPNMHWEKQANDSMETWNIDWEKAADLLRETAGKC